LRGKGLPRLLSVASTTATTTRGATVVPQDRMTWQWRDGTTWRDFDPGLAAQLDRARDAGQATCVYSFRGQPYEVDFQQNTQVNKNTGFARDVRRLGDLASPAFAAPALEQELGVVDGRVVSAPMAFLSDAREDLIAGLRTETGKKISTSAACCVCLLLFIDLIIWLSMSLEQVDSEHYAIPYNKPTGRVRNEVFVEGLHLKPSYGNFILWPKTYETVEEVVECNSEDGVRIELTVRYQYLPREKNLYKLTKMYTEHKEDSDSEFEYIYDKVLAWQARAAIRNGCARYAAQEFQTQRGLVQTEIYTLVSERLDRFMHTDVIDVQLVYIKRPPEYESEVDAKESARNDIDKANNERAQAITQAQTKLLAAETAANKTLDTARTAAQNTLVAATAEASVLTTRYATLAATYKNVKTIHGMSNEALLTYIATRLRGSVAATISLDGPAQTSYIDELT
jgi:regulator of protease activity HflC (stomatin/prohibitin superfamily)